MPIETLLVGCGRLGGAILGGWRLSDAVRMDQLGILMPSEKPITLAAAADGAQINPAGDLDGVQAVVLAVKPAKWRAVAPDLNDRLPRDATIVSVMAGVSTEALTAAFGARPVARVMPTTAVSTARGVATCFAGDDRAVAAARRLFGPIATLVWVEDDALINVATALSGSGAAYAYAFVRDLALAGARRGLSPDQALVLARLTVSGALSRLEGDTPVQTLIDEVASPGGTTEAGLWVLEPGLSSLLDATVEAALNRAWELSS